MLMKFGIYLNRWFEILVNLRLIVRPNSYTQPPCIPNCVHPFYETSSWTNHHSNSSFYYNTFPLIIMLELNTWLGQSMNSVLSFLTICTSMMYFIIYLSTPRLMVNLRHHVYSFPSTVGLEEEIDPTLTTLFVVIPSLPITCKGNIEFVLTYLTLSSLLLHRRSLRYASYLVLLLVLMRNLYVMSSSLLFYPFFSLFLCQIYTRKGQLTFFDLYWACKVVCLLFKEIV